MATRTVMTGELPRVCRTETTILADSPGPSRRRPGPNHWAPAFAGVRLLVDDEVGEVAPAVGDLGEVVAPELLGALADHLAAERLVEEPRAVRLEHPEVEAEEAVAHEVARARAHERAAHAALLVRLQHVERINLGVEPRDAGASLAAGNEADDARVALG